MEVASIHEFHLLMEENDIVMIYDGEFNQEITKSVLLMAEKNLNSEGIENSVRKKIYNVMVETLQNVCKHQHVGNSNIKSAVFMVGETNDHYKVISGNPIKTEHIDVVRSKIDLINSKDKEGLKQLFKELRINSTISDVGGAGLGFVDIVRKSENKLQYKFEEITKDIYFFTLLSKISKTPSKE